MTKPESLFIYVGTYPDEAQARVGYQIIKDLHPAGAAETYDPAVVTRDDGRAHVSTDEMATRHGARGGAAPGAVAGLLFPPAVIGAALAGAAVGGAGMSPKDIDQAVREAAGEAR